MKNGSKEPKTRSKFLFRKDAKQRMLFAKIENQYIRGVPIQKKRLDRSCDQRHSSTKNNTTKPPIHTWQLYAEQFF
jgi:hypothetical protein